MNKLYNFSGTFDDKHKYKAVIIADIGSSPEVLIYNISLSPGPSISEIFQVQFWMSTINLISIGWFLFNQVANLL